MNILNEEHSVQFYRRTVASPVGRALTKFGATYLVWIMALLVTIQLQTLYWVPAVLVSWGVAFLISTRVKRPRPYLAKQFSPIISPSIATTSFPSEHTTIAFAMIPPALIFGGSFAVWFLLLATFVAVARVAAGVHYFSDIIVGALVGLGTSTVCVMGATIVYLWLLSSH